MFLRPELLWAYMNHIFEAVLKDPYLQEEPYGV